MVTLRRLFEYITDEIDSKGLKHRAVSNYKERLDSLRTSLVSGRLSGLAPRGLDTDISDSDLDNILKGYEGMMGTEDRGSRKMSDCLIRNYLRAKSDG